jgi:hypothetical protein
MPIAGAIERQLKFDLEKSNAGAIGLGGVKRRVRFKNPTYAVTVAKFSSDRNIFLQI